MLSWRAAGPIIGRKSWFYWSFVQLMDESGAVSWIESACFTRLSRIRRQGFPAPIWPPVRRITRSIAAAGKVCMCLYLHLLASPDDHWLLVWVHVTCQCSGLWQHKHPAVEDLLLWLHHVRMTRGTFCTLFWMTAVKSVCGLKPSCVVSTSSTVPKLIWTHSHTQKPCEHRHRRVTCFIKCSIKALHLNTI